MSVCCIPPHCKLPASNLLALSEATTFLIILLPLLLPCTKSFLNRPSSLVSAPNKTTTRPPPNPPYPQTMSSARELEDLSLSLSLSSRVPLSLNFSLSQIARELIAEVVQEDVEKSVDKRNEFPSTLFSQIAEKDDRRRSCTRRRPGVRQQEKRGFLQPIHNSHCCC